jgi:flavin reductase (DIM6/NTAB) family NADH-FMN oxidoreductase RutF
MYWDLTDEKAETVPLGSIIVPRPIAWVTTLSRGGVVNLAPYSYFNVVSDDPPVVVLGCGADERPTAGPDRRKDTQRNIEETGEFVLNLATAALLEAVERTGAEVGPEVDELALAGLTPEPSCRVRPPRVAESPVHCECVYLQTLRLPGRSGSTCLVLGRVIGVHARDELLVEHPAAPGRRRVAILRAVPLARLGGVYARIDHELVPAAAPGPRPEAAGPV